MKFSIRRSVISASVESFFPQPFEPTGGRALYRGLYTKHPLWNFFWVAFFIPSGDRFLLFGGCFFNNFRAPFFVKTSPQKYTQTATQKYTQIAPQKIHPNRPPKNTTKSPPKKYHQIAPPKIHPNRPPKNTPKVLPPARTHPQNTCGFFCGFFF